MTEPLYLEDAKGNRLPRFHAPWLSFADPELERQYGPYRGAAIIPRVRLLALVAFTASWMAAHSRGELEAGDWSWQGLTATSPMAVGSAVVLMLAVGVPSFAAIKPFFTIPMGLALMMLWSQASGGVAPEGSMLRSVVVNAASAYALFGFSKMPWSHAALVVLVNTGLWCSAVWQSKGALAALGGLALHLILLFLLSARGLATEHDARLTFWSFLRLTEGGHLTEGVIFTKRPADEDAKYLKDLPSDFQPVFISGLHRSGTTFLYRSLAGVLPVSRFTIYDLVMFPRLLAAHHGGTRKSEQRAMNRYFELVGQATRRLDSTPARHDACEEHGFLLQSLSGRNHVCEANGPLMTTIIQKLRATQGFESNVVLLKNPYDYGHEEEMLKVFPNARFIHLKRNPVDSYNSVCHAMEAVVAPFYYVYMQLCTRHDKQPKIAYGVMQLLMAVMGHDRWMRKLLKGIAGTWQRQVQAGYAALSAVPQERVYELTYDELVADPQGQIRAIADFVGVEADAAGVAELSSNPRAPKIHPCVPLYRDIVTPPSSKDD